MSDRESELLVIGDYGTGAYGPTIFLALVSERAVELGPRTWPRGPFVVTSPLLARD